MTCPYCDPDARYVLAGGPCVCAPWTRVEHIAPGVTLYCGDSLEVLPALVGRHDVASVVTDPPYGLGEHPDPRELLRCWLEGRPYAARGNGFMGKAWDAFVPGPEIWRPVMDLLPPGAHMLAAFGTRTYDLGTLAVRLADAEIRDLVAWLYGSGFPKSLDVSKAIDKAAGAEREVVGVRTFADGTSARQTAGQSGVPGSGAAGQAMLTAPATDAAREWSGWGTALKPALEPWVLARKPLVSVCTNVLENVERGLRSAGYQGEIVWKPEPANAAENSATPPTLSSTGQPPAAETSVGLAAGTGTGSAAPPTASGSETRAENGAPQTSSGAGKCPALPKPSCAPRFSPPMADGASAVERTNPLSSPSITSTEAERNTESVSTARSIPRYDGLASPATATEFYAGIATGLSGSAAHVRINRDQSGAFLWPANLPKRTTASKMTVAQTVLTHGVGALNIDACRVGFADDADRAESVTKNQHETFGSGARGQATVYGSMDRPRDNYAPVGRWPANLCHDGSDEVLAGFPDTRGPGSAARPESIGTGEGVTYMPTKPQGTIYAGETGSAARFFYCAKASKRDRDEGNNHPTVKPEALMAYLCRLITPPGGTVLDPFMGSGSTGKAAVRAGFGFVGIERDPAYFDIAVRRVRAALEDKT